MREGYLRLYIMMQGLKEALGKDQRGQDLVEYALVAALIALAATAGMSTLARTISTAFTNASTKLGTYIP